jgi:hypothetical protein
VFTKICLGCSLEFKTLRQDKKHCSYSCTRKVCNSRHWKKIVSGELPKQRYSIRPTQQRARDFIYIDKINRGCSRCPERRPSCLQYHHLDPAKKLQTIAVLASHSLDLVKAEIEKCIILCANCHFVEELGDGLLQKQIGLGPSQQRTRDFVHQDKLNKGCSRCSERRTTCLQYHHIDPESKLGNISRMAKDVSLIRIVEEIKKCIMLCANCHFVEELGDGYIPNFKSLDDSLAEAKTKRQTEFGSLESFLEDISLQDKPNKRFKSKIVKA